MRRCRDAAVTSLLLAGAGYGYGRIGFLWYDFVDDPFHHLLESIQTPRQRRVRLLPRLGGILVIILLAATCGAPLFATNAKSIVGRIKLAFDLAPSACCRCVRRRPPSEKKKEGDNSDRLDWLQERHLHSQQLRVPFLTLRRFAGGSEPSTTRSDIEGSGAPDSAEERTNRDREAADECAWAVDATRHD